MPLYHFTDRRNLLSILAHGLLSWDRLITKKIKHWPASNDLSRNLDQRANLNDYVRLCVRREHPMLAKALNEGRIQDCAWLEIDEAVIRWPTTRFSNDNATSNRAVIDSNPSTALGSSSNQAEVLVLSTLGTQWIKFPENLPTSPPIFVDEPPF